MNTDNKQHLKIIIGIIKENQPDQTGILNMLNSLYDGIKEPVKVIECGYTAKSNKEASFEKIADEIYPHKATPDYWQEGEWPPLKVKMILEE